MRVLLIEPDDATSADLHRALSRFGVTVHRSLFVPNSVRLDTDVVLLSLRLPKGDFMSDTVRVVETARGRPVVGVVEAADAERAQKAMEAGLAGYVIVQHDSDERVYKVLADALRLTVSAAQPDTGAPRVSTSPSALPQPSPPPEGEQFDLEATLRNLQTILAQVPESVARVPSTGPQAVLDDDFGDMGSYAQRLSFIQKWGWVAGVVAVIFSAGVGYVLFLGKNATDAEVDTKVKEVLTDHNGGIDPRGRDAKGRPYGHHPDLRHAIEANTGVLEEVSTKLDDAEEAQEKLDKRSRYQYEFAKWQVRLNECERKNNCTREDRKKPAKLDALESDLLND